MKVCSKCGLPKDESEYTWSIRENKKHSACNSCRAQDRVDYYERNKDNVSSEMVAKFYHRHFTWLDSLGTPIRYHMDCEIRVGWIIGLEM